MQMALYFREPENEPAMLTLLAVFLIRLQKSRFATTGALIVSFWKAIPDITLSGQYSMYIINMIVFFFVDSFWCLISHMLVNYLCFSKHNGFHEYAFVYSGLS